MAREILLTKNKKAIVDALDFESLNKHRWYATESRKGCFYAVRAIRYVDSRGRSKTRKVYMHNQIAGIDGNLYQKIKRIEVVHKNSNSLLNTRENLIKFKLGTREIVKW